MRLVPWMVALLLLTGCSGSGSRDPALIINNQQSLVMDPSVLSGGITTAPPSSILSNDYPVPVTVYYRFYWYEVQGLDVIPFAVTCMLIVPLAGKPWWRR